HSARQWSFVGESLLELREALAALGQPLVVRTGDVLDVFEAIEAERGIAGLWSHEETGNGWTYARDRRVADWCAARAIPWHEPRQSGVIRRLKSRNGWARRWDRFMGEAVTPGPALEPLAGIPPGAIPSAQDMGLPADPCPGRQTGGRAAGLETLESFLHRRGEPYRKAMSSPLTGFEHCSRLSPHLAWGTLSMRETAQATWARQRALKEAPKGTTGSWRGSMTSFSGRLHWRDHFTQKLEDEPQLEWRNLHRAYDGLRPAEPDGDRLEAWTRGETGLPFVDACMRALMATGWMNFRMRAMLVAVSSYHLWLDWRRPGEHLARLFTDYEPGIHWPQMQMQSGTTGINTVRIYNPVKQGHDHDPDGVFIRRWVPELANVPEGFIHEPWTWDGANQLLGKAYPFPVVDHLDAAKQARQKVWAVRRGPDYRQAANAIQDKHGSRKSGMPATGRRASARKKPRTGGDGQIPLPLGKTEN
ncbi:MAG: deoxyribodipyrimidine photolyase, partial [Alphaproteobacteria bacterium]|nr:deoxyribodipyrimidine photolyase [Alphaproteobacteria bacterium]